MLIERNKKEIIFRLPADFDTFGLQRILNYIKYKEAIKESASNDTEANKLATESKKNWWKENKSKYIK